MAARRHAIVLLALWLPDEAGGFPVAAPVDYVNVLSGAVGGQAVGTYASVGNTLPLVAWPWGFNHWSPQTTNDKTNWYFNSVSDFFRGIRCTHQPSPWIGDYGWFVVRPFIGYASADLRDDYVGFTSYNEYGSLRPYQLDLTVGPSGIRVELVPTNHGALFRFSFPRTVPVEFRKVCVWMPNGGAKDQDEIEASKAGRTTGKCHAAGGGIDVESRKYTSGVPSGTDFVLYARLEATDLAVEEDGEECFEADTKYEPMDMPGSQRSQVGSTAACQARCAATPNCVHFTHWPDGGCHLQDSDAKAQGAATLIAGPPHCEAKKGPRQCCFLAGEATQVEIRVGTSLISAAQSLRALDDEVRGRSYKDLAHEGRAAWHSLLSRVEVADAGQPSALTMRRLEVFYTCLYRVLLFPRRLDENTPDGVRHWSPYDGKVRSGPGVTDNGFWDTFRTVYPLLALAYPKELGELLEGWVNAYRAGGWLPKWASPGYRDTMIGTFADVVLADAIIKNISGFDYAVAWEAIEKDSFTVSGPKDTARGKFGLQHYIDHGYIPVDVGISDACSRTLDFAFADAAAAAAAERLGHSARAEELRGRSLRGLRALHEKSSNIMRRRLKNGAFRDDPPQKWGECFCEGSAWHHSFPPFNISALAELYGGRSQLLDRLRELFETPANFDVGSYKVTIHEMREMRMLGMGQYAHNNQPAHHLPYLFAALGDQNTTAALVRQILARAYFPMGFVGDEDNGEMGAWYVLSAIGLYATALGTTDEYVLGAVPLFPRIRLRDLDVMIEAPAAAEELPAVVGVLWRARQVEGTSLPYSELRNGGVLRFESPGNANLGTIVSSLRGAFHRAVQHVKPVPRLAPQSLPYGSGAAAASHSGGAGKAGGTARWTAWAGLAGVGALAVILACRFWRKPRMLDRND